MVPRLAVSLLVVIVVCTNILPNLAWVNIGPSLNPNPVASTTINNLNTIVADMKGRWNRLDGQCDTDAVFALCYLWMTDVSSKYVAAKYFDDGNAMASLMQRFAGRYLAAYDTWKAGNTDQVTGPWQEAFSWGESGSSNATEDLMLGISAHINYDLAIASWQEHYTLSPLGLPNSISRKFDYDRVNDIIAAVQLNVSEDLGLRYDPALMPTGVNSFTSPALLELLLSWRQNAWDNAVLFEAATSDTARTSLIAATEAAAVTIANSFQQAKPATSTTRRDYCVANHGPSRI